MLSPGLKLCSNYIFKETGGETLARVGPFESQTLMPSLGHAVFCPVSSPSLLKIIQVIIMLPFHVRVPLSLSEQRRAAIPSALWS